MFNFAVQMNQDQETLRVHLRESLLDILHQLQNLDSEHLDRILLRLEQFATHILRLYGVNLISDDIQHLVSQALSCLRGVEELNTEVPFVIDCINSGRRRRPKFNISFLLRISRVS